MQKAKEKNLLPRPPIIVVMGHVDHGKTTLLDYIRKTNLAAKEAGGITQSIGAYEIIHGGKKITFIDTPGHQAFSKMRARGAKVADLGILVVAADDSVKQQTKEAIGHIKSAELTFIVAINKIDKPNADIERVKKDLAAAEVMLEGYGGKISWQAISAKTGEGVNELLDLILLAADLENLTYNPEAPAKGVIIEAEIGSQRGLAASVILKDGILRVGQEISTPSAKGKVKILENFLGKPVDFLEPSAPALIIGFESLPQIGEEFPAETIMPAAAAPKEILLKEGERFKAVLKAPDSGSLEALKDVVAALAEKIEIVEAGIGDIKENDLKTAGATGAAVVGFKVKTDKAAENLAKAKNIKIISSDVIYELIKALERELTELKQLEAGGELEVLALFGKPKGKQQIIGGRVISGLIKNKDDFEIWREGKSLGSGRLKNLQQNKANVPEAKEGEEAGLLIETDAIIKEGDQLKF